MERRGFAVKTAYTVADGLALARRLAPHYAVVDLRLDDGSGLAVVQALREAREDARVIVLTGYGNIATAVAAVKVGATDYLPKPADADQVEAALLARSEEHTSELQSLMRISYAVFCLKKNTNPPVDG